MLLFSRIALPGNSKNGRKVGGKNEERTERTEGKSEVRMKKELKEERPPAHPQLGN